MQVFHGLLPLKRGGMIAAATAAFVLAFGMLAGCSGGDDSGNGNPPPSGQTGTITGVLYAPDGTTPISGGFVYAPRDPNATGTDIPPASAYYTATTTGANGAFTLTNVPTGNTVIRFLKGQFSLKRTVIVGAGQTSVLPKSLTTFPSTGADVPKIAVVTGSYDTIEDVLAKLGLGTLNSSGELVPGTEKFTIYDGGGSAPATAPDHTTLFTNALTMAQYKIIFVNCGADEDILDRADVRTNIRNFVNNGGSLFVSDYAYDYIEAAFPAGVDFYGSPGVPASQIEDRDAAQVIYGEADATVRDTAMKNWLQARGALNAAGKVRIEDFYTVIDAVPASTKVWLEAPIDYPSFGSVATTAARAHNHQHGTSAPASTRAIVTKPQTVTFDSGQGRALFTTFHTVATPSVALRPQEQILAYLVFEL